MTAIAVILSVILGITSFTLGVVVLAANGRIDDLERDKQRLQHSLNYSDRLAYTFRVEYERAFIKLKRLQSTPTSAKTAPVSWRTVMGFSKDATLTRALVDSRYKKLAKVYHPDLDGGTPYAMQLLNLAKEKADMEIK